MFIPDLLFFDMEIRPEKAEYAPGETVKVFSGVVAGVAGVQGWSYGVKHEDSVLELLSVTTDGTDVPGVFSQGFNQTTKENIAGGWIQAVVLSFVSPSEIPVSSFFSMADARYTALECADKTKIEFTDQLSLTPTAHSHNAADGSKNTRYA